MRDMRLLLYKRVSNKFSLYAFISARYAPPPPPHHHHRCTLAQHMSMRYSHSSRTLANMSWVMDGCFNAALHFILCCWKERDVINIVFYNAFAPLLTKSQIVMSGDFGDQYSKTLTCRFQCGGGPTCWYMKLSESVSNWGKRYISYIIEMRYVVPVTVFSAK